MEEIAEKIKNQTATEEETLFFTKEFNKILEDMSKEE